MPALAELLKPRPLPKLVIEKDVPPPVNIPGAHVHQQVGAWRVASLED